MSCINFLYNMTSFILNVWSLFALILVKLHKFGKLILTKIFKIVATMSHFTAEMHQTPRWGSLQRSQDLLPGFNGVLLVRGERQMGVGGTREGMAHPLTNFQTT